MIPESVKTRIEKDAEQYERPKIGWQFVNDEMQGYVSGATAEYERAQPLIKKLEIILENWDGYSKQSIINTIEQALKIYNQ